MPDASTQRFLNALIREPRVKLDATIITAADADYFVPLQCLLASIGLSHDCRVVVVDLGLTAKQRTWCRQQGVEVVAAPKLAVPRSRFMWQTWNKPAYLSHAGGKVIWIDADCIVTGSLAWMDKLLKLRPVLFADTAATHFCGWKDGVRTVANDRQLYLHKEFQTPIRFGPGEAPNAGVLGFDLDNPQQRELLAAWRAMVKRAAGDKRLLDRRSKSHDKQGWLAWYDQGALQWALERRGETDLVIADSRFNDPVHAHGAKSLDELTGKIERLQTSRLVHFPSGGKPYGTFPRDFDPDTRDYPRSRQDLTLFVLGHEKTRLAKCKSAPHAKLIHLPDIDANNELAESRIFQSPLISRCQTEYIGLCTARWNEKYAGECLPLESLHRLRMNVSTVWAARPAWSDWLEASERDHPGMAKIVAHVAGEMGVRDVFRESVWSNNFIAHRSVAAGLQEWFWRAWGIVCAEFGPRPKYGMEAWDATRTGSYLAERLSMIYFCMRDDLEIKPIGLIAATRPRDA